MSQIFLENHSSIASSLLSDMVNEAIAAYQSVFTDPSCVIRITICRDREEMENITAAHTHEIEEEWQPGIDGVFLCPQDPRDEYRILILGQKIWIPGAERFFAEKANGSLRDADLSEMDRNRRGMDFGTFFPFADMFLHEYSHLCSFERFMNATGWADPSIGAHSMDYLLYDEQIAQYRGTYSALRMFEPYMERDLLYSLWKHDWQNVRNVFEEQDWAMKSFILERKPEVYDLLNTVMQTCHVSPYEIVRELETMFGHKLAYGGQLNRRGVPRLSQEEIVEYMMSADDELRHALLPISYYVKHSHATYQGAHMDGLVRAYYDFLVFKARHVQGEPDRVMTDPDGLFQLTTSPEKLDIVKQMDVPYYRQIDEEGNQKRRSQLDKLIGAAFPPEP